MQIADNAVVHIHYTLTNDAGDKLDSSAGSEPLAYLHGFSNIIPGLEAALESKAAGDKLNVRIPAEEAYGERQDELVQDVPLEALKEVGDLQVGMQLQAQAEDGVQVFTIKAIGEETATLDGNHPLAGEALTFDVEVVGVKEASAEELEHGHVHGPGGHEH
jgi:FKBP-type peptidyl-prolyl cis-trans isomerase SlyD